MFCYKNVGRPLMTTVSNGDRKDTDMKLLLIFAAILAFSLAEEEKKNVEILDDSQAEASASIELMKEGADLKAAASTYNSYVPPNQRPTNWNVPQNSWQQPVKPIQPVQTSVPAHGQSDYYWSTPVYHPPTTAAPVAVIKDERYYGENGAYKFEYKLGDGTWVGEEGYFTDPKQTEESLVKKGWYSFVGADGKTYTVSWWADQSGYHAFGDHLPTPPPPAAKPVYDNKPQHDEPIQTPVQVYPSQTPPPVYYPTQPVTFAPPKKPIYVPPQPQLPIYQPQYPPQQQYYPPQQNYYPQQPTNHV